MTEDNGKTQQIKALTKSIENLKGQQEIGKLQVVLNFIERVKWWLLITVLLAALLITGSSPADIVQWAKEIMASLNFGN